MSVRKTTPGWKVAETGDVVDIIAPSWNISPSALSESIKCVEDMGLVPRVPEDLFGKDLFCANRIEARERHLIDAIRAKDSSFIWALRGGHGAGEMLTRLKKLQKVPNKTFIGLSDITSLHLFFNQHWGWATVHGSNLNGLRKKWRSRHVKETRDLIFGRQSEVCFKGLKPLNDIAMRRAKIDSKVIGGNLVVASSLIGTPFLGKTSGKILFFEDVGERAYRIDRLLVQWEQAGLFKGVKAIVLGDFTNCHEQDGRNLVGAVWKRFAERSRFPVLSGIRSGHDKIRRPVPFNTRSVLKTAGDRAELICDSGAKGA